MPKLPSSPSFMPLSALAALGLVLALAACAAPPQPPPAVPVDPAQVIIFHNGVILTMESDQPVVEAMALRGEKIEALGSSADLLARPPAGAVLVDLEGRTLMPGFVDAHSHVLNDARSQGRSLDQAQVRALSNGITTLGALYVDEAFLSEIQAFDNHGALRVRTSLYLVANTNCGRLTGSWYKRHAPTRQPGEMLRIGGIKIFTDGGSCGGVALSFELTPGSGQGDLWLTQDQLNRLVADAQAAGVQAAIHAIGDRAVSQALDAVEFALDGGPNVHRHRLEHVSVLRPEFIPRFGQLGVVPVVNGQYPVCTPYGPPLPADYHAWEWPWRDLRSTNPNLPIAWHSDDPYLSIRPFVHLFGFVTRHDLYQNRTCAAPDYLLDDTLTVEQALSIMTVQSAYALFRDEEVGSLRPGKYADVIVVSGNPLTTPAEDLKSQRVLVTMVGGRFEYCDPRNLALCPGFAARTPIPLPDLRPPETVRWLAPGLALALLAAAAVLFLRSATRGRMATLSSAAGMLGGVLWAWAWVSGVANPGASWPASTWVVLAGSTLLAIAALGLLGRDRAWWLGWLGAAAASLGALAMGLGFVLSEWFRTDAGWFLIALGVIVHASGLVLYGLSNLGASRRSVRSVLPLVVGLLGGWLPFVWGSLLAESDWPAILFGVVLGLGWTLMGLLALTDRGAGARPTR